MNTNRVNELIASMKSFEKEKYHRDELITEMLDLQREMVEITFAGEDISKSELRIWDVEKRLSELNRECNFVAWEELKRFRDSSKKFNNLICAEFSGRRGERKAFSNLQYLRTKNVVLKNVELSDGNVKTELDAIVITPKAVTIIEVKNTAKDIFIAETGGYYRTGEYLRWDCNIGSKMALKESLLRKALSDGGMEDVEIKKVVVFTNNRIEVHNKCRDLRTCFVSQLAHIIDGCKTDRCYTDDEMSYMEELIKVAENKESYSFEFDVKRYKQEFATVVATLESLSEKNVESVKDIPAKPEEKNGLMSMIRNFLSSKYTEYVSGTVAAALITFLSSDIMDVIKG